MTPTNPFLPVNDDARDAARRLAREARHGALACLEPGSGSPLASRASLAPDITGDPVLLVSRLSAHTTALLADGRAALLIGEPGAGDPLSHPRLSLQGMAVPIDHRHGDHARIRRRFLFRQPGAALYVDFPDFLFLRIGIEGGLLNRGFARAYRLTREDITEPVSDDIVGAEERVCSHMNEDHTDAIDRLVRRARPDADEGWRIATIDRRGFDAIKDDTVVRIAFRRPIERASDFRAAFVELASETD